MDFFADIIKEQVIDKLPLTIKVKSVSSNLLLVDDTYFLRKGPKITDNNGDSYEVLSFVKDTSITVTGSGFSGDVHVRKPSFMWGTQRATNAEYLEISSYSEDKLPMIWLLDGWIENLNETGSSEDASVNCRFFFLDSVDFNMINEDVKDDWQKPMFKLSDVFMETMEKNIKYFNYIGGKVRRPRTRFGTETEEGTDATIINDELTGCELTCDVSINKVGYKKCALS